MLKVNYKFYNDDVVLYFINNGFTIGHYYTNRCNLMVYYNNENDEYIIKEYLRTVGFNIKDVV